MIEVKAFYIYTFSSLANNFLFRNKSRPRGLLKLPEFFIFCYLFFLGSGNVFPHETGLSPETPTSGLGWGFFSMYFVKTHDALLIAFI